MAQITDEQLDLLEKLVDDYWSDDGGAKEDFFFTTTFQAGTMIRLADQTEEVAFGDLEELARFGLVALSLNNSGRREGTLRPTGDGKAKIEERRQIAEVAKPDRALSTGGPGVGWEATQPILQTIVELYDQADPGEDVSQMDVCKRLVKPEGDPGVSRAFEVLERSGYVEKRWEIDNVPGPLTVAPTEKALQMASDWPTSGAVALEKLLAILDQRIADTPDEEEKGKLRAFRDSVVDVGENIAAEVLVKLMMG